MYHLIAAIVNTMQYAYVGWNYLWWSYHMTLARHHDSRKGWHNYWFKYHVSRARVADFRIAKLDAEWSKKLEKNWYIGGNCYG